MWYLQDPVPMNELSLIIKVNCNNEISQKLVFISVIGYKI